jgi:hypothetical protein
MVKLLGMSVPIMNDELCFLAHYIHLLVLAQFLQLSEKLIITLLLFLI